MLTQDETNRIKSYHEVMGVAKDSIAGIIADSWERTRQERTERAKIMRDEQTAAVNEYTATLQKEIEKSGVFKLKRMLKLI